MFFPPAPPNPGIYLCLISHHSVSNYSKEPVSTGDSLNLQLWDQLKDPVPSVRGYKFPLCLKAGVGMRRKGAKGLTFIECLLHSSHCTDSFTYSVLCARYCSHATGDRLWEVQHFVQGYTASMWPRYIPSHAFLRGFLLHLATWTFLPTSLRYLYFPFGCFLKNGTSTSISYCYILTQRQLKKHKPYNKNITEFDCIRIKNFYNQGYHDTRCEMIRWEKILS